MKVILSFTILLSALAASPSTPAFPQATPDQTFGTISGHIYRADNRAPVVGAAVSLKRAGGGVTHTAPANSDSTGSYTFTNVPPGKYSVEAECAGYLKGMYNDNVDGSDDDDDNSSQFTLKPGASRNHVDIRLDLLGAISGTVLDENGKPVSGLRVTAAIPFFLGDRELDFDPNYATSPYATPILPEPGHTSSAITDTLGYFRLPGLVADSYAVLAEGNRKSNTAPSGPPGLSEATYRLVYYYPHASNAGQAQRIPLAPGAEVEGIDFIITKQVKTFTVRGTISNFAPDAARLPSVHLFRLGGILRGVRDIVASATPAANGEYVLSGVPPGDYLLTAYQSKKSDRELNPGVPGPTVQQYAPAGSYFATVHVQDSDVELNFAMGLLGSVHGKVILDGASKLPYSFSLGLAPDLPGIDGMASDRVQTDDADEFDLPEVLSGHYRFVVIPHLSRPQPRLAPVPLYYYVKHAECAGTDYTNAPLTIRSDSRFTDCTITIANDWSSLTGRVISDDPWPYADWLVIAIPASSDLAHTRTYSQRTYDNRTFNLPVAPGDYLLFAAPMDLERSYLDPNFAERNAALAVRVTVNPKESKTFQLTPTKPVQ